MSKLMTQKEYADHYGCKKQYINTLVGNGVIPLDESGKIDQESADSILADRRQKRTKEAADVKLADLKLNYARNKMKYQREAGELLPIKEVAATQFSLARKLRDDLLILPGKISGQLVGKSEREIKLSLPKKACLSLGVFPDQLTV
ncbi:hypothetical protein ACQZV8_18820 [Magnetococcales bacterium HHB-1]